MQITQKNPTPTKAELTIVAEASDLMSTKEAVLKALAKNVNLAGFRKGHAPLHLVEKNVDQNLLQSQFLDEAINQLYATAVAEKQLRPVAQPEVSITKFVPYTTVELKVDVEVLGPIKLADYKKFKVAKTVEPTTAKDVDTVISDLLARDAAKKAVERATKEGDEVVIDFAGKDAKTKEPIDGGSASDYPLIIGSNTFIPGFEPELINLKKGDEKTFELVFPKDYGAATLQGKKVSFDVTVKEVREVVKPKLTDEFVAKVGPFKTVAELKADVKKQLQAEREAQAQRKFESDLLEKLALGSDVEVPVALVDEEIERMEEEEKRNLMYRGQTWQEHLKAEGKTEEQHREEKREQAELRVKSGLVLGDVAQLEKLDVTNDELDERIAELKKQYNDAQMQAELDKPENRREIASRILTEKTLSLLATYAAK